MSPLPRSTGSLGPLVLCAALAGFPASALVPRAHGATDGTATIAGHLEVRAIHYRLHQDGAAYQTGYAGLAQRESLDRATATLKVSGTAATGDWRLSGRLHLGWDRDQVEHESERRFDELFASWAPAAGLALDAGKIVQRWGRGRVWNPAAFVERPKDPTDPRLAREGYTMFAGRLRHAIDEATTLTFNPVLLPVSDRINDGFGTANRLNVAARVLVDRGPTELSFQFLAEGSRSARRGFVVSHDVDGDLEVYGEWAQVSAQSFRTASPTGDVRERRERATSWLAGVEVRAAHRMTYLAELYHNATGFRPAEFRDFAELADNAVGAGPDSRLMARAQSLASGGFGRSQPMRNYLHLRASRSAPILGHAVVPSVRATFNLDDGSRSLTPELLHHARGRPWGWRLRVNFLSGRPGTEYGEKRHARRLDLAVHHHF